MSEENVEIVRAGFAAYNGRDPDAVLEYWAPHGVLDWSNSRGLGAGIYRGRDEIRAAAEGFLAMWDEVRIEIVDAVEVRDGLVIAENVTYMRGRDGIELQARSAWLIKVRDGKQTSLTLYQTKQEALEAAGLSE
jgi:ketosteroid isomerase-like protein